MDSLASVVTVTKESVIPNELGGVYHFMKLDSTGYDGFEEVYFSRVNFGVTKGWKLHARMTLNLVVPVGEILVTIRDGRPGADPNAVCLNIILSEKNYYRVTVPPSLWVAYTGLGNPFSLLANFANLRHDPREASSVPISTFAIKNH